MYWYKITTANEVTVAATTAVDQPGSALGGVLARCYPLQGTLLRATNITSI